MILLSFCSLARFESRLSVFVWKGVGYLLMEIYLILLNYLFNAAGLQFIKQQSCQFVVRKSFQIIRYQKTFPIVIMMALGVWDYLIAYRVVAKQFYGVVCDILLASLCRIYGSSFEFIVRLSYYFILFFSPFFWNSFYYRYKKLVFSKRCY